MSKALNRAIAAGRFRQVRLLIRTGLDINTCSATFPRHPLIEALHIAKDTTRCDMFRFLLNLGASPLIFDAGTGRTLLSWACLLNRQAEIKNILSRCTGDIDIALTDMHECSALHYAVLHRNADVVVHLVEDMRQYGVSVDVSGPEGLTPFLLARYMKAENLCRILTSLGFASRGQLYGHLYPLSPPYRDSNNTKSLGKRNHITNLLNENDVHHAGQVVTWFLQTIRQYSAEVESLPCHSSPGEHDRDVSASSCNSKTITDQTGLYGESLFDVGSDSIPRAISNKLLCGKDRHQNGCCCCRDHLQRLFPLVSAQESLSFRPPVPPPPPPRRHSTFPVLLSLMSSVRISTRRAKKRQVIKKVKAAMETPRFKWGRVLRRDSDSLLLSPDRNVEMSGDQLDGGDRGGSSYGQKRGTSRLALRRTSSCLSLSPSLTPSPHRCDMSSVTPGPSEGRPTPLQHELSR